MHDEVTGYLGDIVRIRLLFRMMLAIPHGVVEDASPLLVADLLDAGNDVAASLEDDFHFLSQ